MATKASDRSKGMKKLVIVESPSKVKNISSYLGDGYIVESSVGHIRDLPRGAADIPAKYKSESWARLGVNVDDDFAPLYVVSADRKKKVTELKQALAQADELYLATDGDREGEAIAWHLLETLKPNVPVHRMVFHEITKTAILAAAQNPRDINLSLVDAQETRRILDRLYGYEVSPVLWRKVMPKLSAGRVQSVATRVVVERERERIAFKTANYWDITAKLRQGSISFPARLHSIDGIRVASGKDFSAKGNLASKDIISLNETTANELVDKLKDSDFIVSSIESKPYTRKPYAPFITSTLQQEASRKLRFTSERTMRTAQRLYEAGYITYMRTDSIVLSQTAIDAARKQVSSLYGAEYLPSSPRVYASKVKNAQEAHEAIRPAGETFLTPKSLSGKLDPDEFKLYELIWQRTVASQMNDAKGTTVSARIVSKTSDKRELTFAASGRTISFPGFLSAYVETVDDLEGGEADDSQVQLPPMFKDQKLDVDSIESLSHNTNPPARYTEASLIKKMSDLGIGRPSTYTSILNNIQSRGYVHKKGSALVPSWVAFAVIGLMEQHFQSLVDYGFTATMEDDLDDIAKGEKLRISWLNEFYFGDSTKASQADRHKGLKNLVGANLEEIDAREVNSLHFFDDANQIPVYVRVGKFGPYLERTVKDETGELVAQRANLPENLTPDELTIEIAEKLFSTPQSGRILGVDPQSGYEIAVKEGRFSSYITEIIPEPEPPVETEGKKKKVAVIKPKTASLFKSMDTATINLDDALKLLSLPRLVGVDPTSGEEIKSQNGRYGPYLTKGTDSRSLNTEEEIFTVTLDEAVKIYAEPKRRGRTASAAAPLKELGNDTVSGKPMLVKDGRFGPYVTDGETNASIPKSSSVEGITDEEASELLAVRRAKIANGEVKPKPKAKAKPKTVAKSRISKPKSTTTRTVKAKTKKKV